MVGYPAELKTAKDIAGVLRRVNDDLADKSPFRFATVEKLLREILTDYPDPYEVAVVLSRAAYRGELDLGGEVWNTLDVRAYARLRTWYWMPEGMGRYAYLMDFVAGASLWAQCYPWLAAWEDAADDSRAITKAQAELDRLLEGIGGRSSADTSRS